MGSRSSRTSRGDSATIALAGGWDLLVTATVILAAFGGSLWLFEAIWHRDALEDIAAQPGGWIAAVIIVIGSALVHEAIHALGWRFFAHVPWQVMSLRASWRGMGIAADPGAPVRASAHRAARILPALVLGGMSITIGLATGGGLLVLWGLFFLLECYTDIAILFALRGLPSEARILDVWDRLGCRIVAGDQSERRE